MTISINPERGQPLVTDGSRTVGDLNDIIDWAAARATRMAGTRSQRLALPAAKLFPGLLWDEIDTDQVFKVNDVGDGWQNANARREAVNTGVFEFFTGWDQGTGVQRSSTGVDRIQLNLTFRRTGADIVVPADGILALSIGRLLVPPIVECGLGAGRNTRPSRYWADVDGITQLVSATPGSTIPTGTYLSIADSYPYM